LVLLASLSLAACATSQQSADTAAGAVGGAIVGGPVGAVAGAVVGAPGGPLDPALLIRRIGVGHRAQSAYAFCKYAGNCFLKLRICDSAVGVRFPRSILSKPRRFRKTRFPSFLTLNPLISRKPPKEILGKSLGKVWRPAKLVNDFSERNRRRLAEKCHTKAFPKFLGGADL
jgi:hypothetical protein